MYQSTTFGRRQRKRNSGRKGGIGQGFQRGKKEREQHQIDASRGTGTSKTAQTLTSENFKVVWNPEIICLEQKGPASPSNTPT